MIFARLIGAELCVPPVVESPTSDEEMEKLKFERAALKDKVFQKLRSA